ncbi:MAG: PEP-CTERM sorting domain-containing protein [Phycisphaeraceae bacterium]|nr:PEP-CTERM sorting domain-containing protein [Phycisphaeraceae bacterium]
MKTSMHATIAILTVVTLTSNIAKAEGHYDIAPYFDAQSGTLLTGGLDHSGNHTAPPISVYGYEFGEDEFDPFNPTDPGVNQSAGVGNLPAGSPVRYNVLSSLLYWDGDGDVAWSGPLGDTHIDLLVGTSSRTLTGISGAQAGSLIQTVAANGSLHKHFVTSLFVDYVSSNVPDEPGYLAPADGIYAFSLELTLTQGDTLFVSDPIWIVFNNGMDEEIHDAAMAAVPEPASIGLLAFGGLAMMRRRQVRN